MQEGAPEYMIDFTICDTFCQVILSLFKFILNMRPYSLCVFIFIIIDKPTFICYNLDDLLQN